jgi:hypothetical protein
VRPETFAALIDRGAPEAVLAATRALDEKARLPLAPTALAKQKEAQREFWSIGPGDPMSKHWGARFRASNAAVLATATVAEILSNRAVFELDIALAAQALSRRELAGTAGIAAALVERVREYWGAAHRLVQDGLCDRPTSDSWCLGFLHHRGSKIGAERGAVESPAVHLDDDDFVKTELWRLFEIDGDTAISWALVDKFMVDERLRWSAALVAAAARGRVTRARLLDATLDALSRDFVPFRAGWFSALHEELEPAPAERLARVDAYLGLLASRVAPTVSFALDALAEIAPKLPGARVLARVGPALAARTKRPALAAVDLVALIAAQPELAREAALVVTEALAHEAAPVQARALAVVAKHGEREDAALVDRLRALEPAVAPTVRVKLLEWLGAPAGAAPIAALAPAAAVEPRRPARAPAPPLARAGSLDEAIALLAGAIERLEVPDEVEGALAGVARFCGERPGDFDEHLAPLAKRAAKLLDKSAWVRFAGVDFRGDLAAVAAAWHSRRPPEPPDAKERSMRILLASRVHEVAVRARDARPTTLLATPTDADGWIDPGALVARAKGVTPDPCDAVQSLLRLAREGRPAALAGAAAVAGEYGAALRFALGGAREGEPVETDLWLAAEAARTGDDLTPRFPLLGNPMTLHVDAEDRSLPKLLSFMMRWVATVFPASYENLFRAGGSAMLAWHNQRHALWWNPVYLEPLLRPDVAFEKNAQRLVAVALSTVQAAEGGLAADALIQIVDDGRGDAVALGDTFARLLVAGVAAVRHRDEQLAALRADEIPNAPLSCARWARRLQDVARASPRHAGFVRDVLARVVPAIPTPPPRDVAPLLALLHELCVETGRPLEGDAARARLAGFSGGSQAAVTARALLTLTHPAPRLSG